MELPLLFPHDYESPNWDDISSSHDWKFYAAPHLIEAWADMSDHYKTLISANLVQIAKNKSNDKIHRTPHPTC